MTSESGSEKGRGVDISFFPNLLGAQGVPMQIWPSGPTSQKSRKGTRQPEGGQSSRLHLAGRCQCVVRSSRETSWADCTQDRESFIIMGSCSYVSQNKDLWGDGQLSTCHKIKKRKMWGKPQQA